MKKPRQITINDGVINLTQSDYISLTDMLKAKDGDFFISDWLRNRNTIEFLSVWEGLHNPNFNYGESAIIKNQAGLNSYKISVREWVDKTNAIGLTAKTGRYGGTYAHQDIAFEFASWISPTFKLYLIKEFQRLKEIEHNQHNIDWNVKRLISKANYALHTEAVKNYILPKSLLPLDRQGILYATEADILNIAVFGYTAKQWKEKNPKKALNGENIRETASINELTVLATLEAINAELIKSNVDREKRLATLTRMASEQLAVLDKSSSAKALKKISDSVYIDNMGKTSSPKPLKGKTEEPGASEA